MTTATIERLSDIQDKVLDVVVRIQEPVVSGVKHVVTFVDDNLPELPQVPMVEQLPTSKELVNNQFGFADKMLKTNKRFATAVADATKPLETQLRTGAPAAKPKAKSTTKTKSKAKASTKKAASKATKNSA